MDDSRVTAPIELCDGSGGLVTKGLCGVGSECGLLDGAAGRGSTEKLCAGDFTAGAWPEVPFDPPPGDAPLELSSTDRILT